MNSWAKIVSREVTVDPITVSLINENDGKIAWIELRIASIYCTLRSLPRATFCCLQTSEFADRRNVRWREIQRQWRGNRRDLEPCFVAKDKKHYMMIYKWYKKLEDLYNPCIVPIRNYWGNQDTRITKSHFVKMWFLLKRYGIFSLPGM